MQQHRIAVAEARRKVEEEQNLRKAVKIQCASEERSKAKFETVVTRIAGGHINKLFRQAEIDYGFDKSRLNNAVNRLLTGGPITVSIGRPTKGLNTDFLNSIKKKPYLKIWREILKE